MTLSCPRLPVKALLAFVFALALAGCATTPPPVQEMSDARQAVQAARAADELAQPEALERAEALLEEASHALAERRYREARVAALQAKEEAIRAREPAVVPRQ